MMDTVSFLSEQKYTKCMNSTELCSVAPLRAGCGTSVHFQTYNFKPVLEVLERIETSVVLLHHGGKPQVSRLFLSPPSSSWTQEHDYG